MDEKLVRYTLRVDRLLFKKFRYIAESEGRSANKEIEQYLKKRVAVGAGSSLIKGAKTGDYDLITETGKLFVERIKEARAEMKK